jgi:hypothetical protein
MAPSCVITRTSERDEEDEGDGEAEHGADAAGQDAGEGAADAARRGGDAGAEEPEEREDAERDGGDREGVAGLHRGEVHDAAGGVLPVARPGEGEGRDGEGGGEEGEAPAALRADAGSGRSMRRQAQSGSAASA